MGAALSTDSALPAMYSSAIGSEECKGLAWQAFSYGLYASKDQGGARDNSLRPTYGGWQEDAHTKGPNYMDRIAAFHEWSTQS